MSHSPKVSKSRAGYKIRRLSKQIGKLGLDRDAINRLSHNLARVERGSDLAIIAPIFGDRAPEDVLKGWDNLFEPRARTLRATLAEMEASNRSKFGPRSLAKPWEERKDDVLATFKQPHFEGPFRDSEVAAHAVAEFTGTPVSRDWHRLRPLSLPEAALYLQPNTSAGLPTLCKKKDVLADTVANHQALLVRDDPAVMFTRTQEQRKTRLVWGQPIASVLEEMAFFQVLLPYRKMADHRSALRGPDAVELRVGWLFDRVGPRESIVSVDFSSYDASVSPYLSMVALKILLALAFQSSNNDRISEIVRRFTECGLVTPDGILAGPHGVPSGSGFTNEVDSVVQYLVARFIARRIGRSDYHRCDVQGDDGLHILRNVDVSAFIEGFHTFNLHLNADKSHTSPDECIYLQNYFHKEDRLPNGAAKGQYPTYRALNRIVHPERWTDLDEELTGRDFYAIRTISILENCKRHPMFSDFVKYVASISDLSFSSAGHEAYLSRIVTKGGAGILNQHGEAVKGIRNFETMKILNG